MCNNYSHTYVNHCLDVTDLRVFKSNFVTDRA